MSQHTLSMRGAETYTGSSNGNGHPRFIDIPRKRRKRETKRATPRRVDWHDPDQLTAVVLAAFGFSPKVIEAETGLTHNQQYHRFAKAGVKPTDYRFCRPGTTGNQIAGAMLKEAQRHYRGTIANKLKRDLPTKAQAKRLTAARANEAH
jgi:hypothetical protein